MSQLTPDAGKKCDISAVEVIPYALPFRAPYVTARGRIERREMVLLRLRGPEGLVGLGEAVPLSLRGGTAIGQVVSELEGLAAAGLDSAAMATAAATLSAPARCAVLTALEDLRRRLDQAEGGEGAAYFERPRFARCNATLVAGEPAAVAAEAERWATRGFSTFKLKLGVGDDIGQVRAVREALGDEARIRVDANGAWSVEEAHRVLAAIEPLDIELVEQPVASLEEMAQLAALTPIPLAADESITDRAEAERAVAMGGCALAAVKLSKVGGVAAAEAIAEVMPTYLSSALDGPVGIAAAVQLAWETGSDNPFDEQLAHGLATQRLFSETIAACECQLFDDVLQMPRGPGLGVEIDEDSLQAHRLR